MYVDVLEHYQSTESYSSLCMPDTPLDNAFIMHCIIYAWTSQLQFLLLIMSKECVKEKQLI